MTKYLKQCLPSLVGALLVAFTSTAHSEATDRSVPTETPPPANPSQIPLPEPFVTTNDIPKIIEFLKQPRPGGSGALGRPTFYNEYGPI